MRSILHTISEMSIIPVNQTFSSGSSISTMSNTLPSQDSVTSQGSSSVFSQTSLQSQVSLQSELSLLSSQTSLSFLPSLVSLTNSDGKLQLPSPFSSVYESDCVATLKIAEAGHVSCLIVSGGILYAGLTAGKIRAWKLKLGGEGKVSFMEMEENEEKKCSGKKVGMAADGALKSIVVVGSRVFSAHQDQKIRVWIGQKLHATMPTLRDYFFTFLLPKNYVQVRRHKKRLWIQHMDAISALAVITSSGGGQEELLYSASWDRSVKVWRLSDLSCVESFHAHDDAINALMVLPDGAHVYTASADARIKVWARQPGSKVKHALVSTLEGHKSAVNALALSHDGTMLYSGACDRSIIVWEREESAQHMVAAGALRGHRRAILCLASAPGADILCSGSADKTIRVWKRSAGSNLHSCLTILQGHTAPIKCIYVHYANNNNNNNNNTSSGSGNDDCLVFSGSLDHDIKVWNIRPIPIIK